MNHEIITFPHTVLVGITKEMSMVNDRTAELWKTFMPQTVPLRKTHSTDLFSVQEFGSPEYFRQFDPMADFKKSAMIREEDLEQVPKDFRTLVIPEGLYARFPYKGKPSEAAPFIQRIFSQWLPGSGYRLEERPHLAVMGEKYLGDDPDSEEDFLIPVTRT